MKAGGEATLMPGRRWEEEGMMRGTREKNEIDSVSGSGRIGEGAQSMDRVSTSRDGKTRDIWGLC